MATEINADDLQIIRELEALVDYPIPMADNYWYHSRCYLPDDGGRIERLYLSNCYLTHLEEVVPLLRQLPALAHLDLQWNFLRDIKPLVVLHNLRGLDLDYCPLEDIRPLASLGQLEELSLNNTEVLDISPLTNASRLKRLDITTNIRDIKPLLTMPLLRELSLGIEEPSDLMPLGGLDALEKFSFFGDQLDLSLLQGLSSLHELNLNYAECENFDALSRLKELRTLDLDTSGIADLAPLSNLTALEELNLTAADVKDIRPLARLVHLRQLSLQEVLLRDISPLEALVNLEDLDLDCTEITDTGFLRRFKKLKKLCLDGGNSDLSPLPGLVDLEDLQLLNSEASNLDILGDCGSLQDLDLQGSRSENFQFLSRLINLRRLTLDNTGIQDLGPVATLTKLSQISFSDTYVTNLSPLAGLVSLQGIDCRKTGIKDLAPLEAMTKLRQLIIGGTNVTNVDALAYLDHLVSLQIDSTLIKDPSPLAKTFTLLSIGLSNSKVADLWPLKDLKGIEHLTFFASPLEDMTPLNSFPKLQELKLSTLSPLQFIPLPALKKLQRLELSNIQLKDIVQLGDLSFLKHLDVRQSNLKEFDESIFERLPWLQSLQLQDNPGLNIPAAISDQQNCLIDLKSYCKDRKAGIIPAYETKVILVGNGRVGKTCLLKRWLDNDFNPEEPSTHGIQLRKWPLPDLAKQQGMEKVQLNIWDFGGQDIYHATHQVFLNSEAIFLLVWDAQTEGAPTQDEALPDHTLVRYRNYSLTYWLSYIKTLSKDSPVIIVQTRRGRDGRRNNVLTQDQQEEYNVKGMLAVESSLAVGNGYDALKDRLLEVVIHQIETSCTAIPTSWYRIRNELARLSEQRDPVIRQLPLADFHVLCAAESLDDRSANTLLNYFHNTGVLFHAKGIFDNQIVLDQQWAIEAVYALFNRKSTFSVLHQEGVFTGQDLREIWQKYSDGEQELFLSFMKKCEICFEVEPDTKKPFGDRMYIAPQLLPEWGPDRIQTAISMVFDEGQGLFFRYRHRVLHAAIIRRFIVRVGELATYKQMWRDGIIIITAEGKAMISVAQEKNELTVRLQKPSQLSLLTKIRNEIRQITSDRPDIRESISLDGKGFVSLDELATYPGEYRQIRADNDTWVDTQPLLPFLEVDKRKKFTKKDIPKTARPEILVSYKHGGKSQVITDNLCNTLKAAGYRIVRDKDNLGYKELVSDFMSNRIGMGRFVIIVFSDEYLKSDNCMFELVEVFRRSGLDKAETLKRIFPLRTEDLKLDDPEILEGYFDHWKEETNRWESYRMKLLQHGQSADPIKYQQVSSIFNNWKPLGDLLSDINLDSIERLAADDFAEIRRAIDRQALLE